MDVFLKDRPVATNYDFSMTQGSRIIFEQSGISTDSKEESNVVEFLIPDDVSGIVHLNFNNLDNNGLAKTAIPIVITIRDFGIRLMEAEGIDVEHYKK